MTATELRFDGYRIWELDSRNWCLEFDTGKPSLTREKEPTGENIKRFIGYYSDISGALQSALHDGLRGRGAVEAQNLMDCIGAALDDARRAVAAIS